jgi:hypothetical protein
MRLRASQERVGDAVEEMADYLIETPEGAVGILDGCKRDWRGRPKTLIVAQGWFGRQRLEIPVQQVTEVDHRRKRILLTRGAAPLERKGLLDLLQRLVEVGQERSARVNAANPRSDAGGGRPVLCGVEEDERALTVVTVAAQLAKRLDAPLAITHVTASDIPAGVSAALA